MNGNGDSGAGGGDAAETATLEELERERLVTYLDWAEVDAPPWYWPTYAVAVGGWIASYDLGPRWGTAAAVVVAITMGLLIRAVTGRSGVSTPRFRGMPAALRRTFVPLVVVAVGAVAAVVTASAVLQDPPYTLLGIVVGPALAAAGVWNGFRYRREASRIAGEAGIAR